MARHASTTPLHTQPLTLALRNFHWFDTSVSRPLHFATRKRSHLPSTILIGPGTPAFRHRGHITDNDVRLCYNFVILHPPSAGQPLPEHAKTPHAHERSAELPPATIPESKRVSSRNSFLFARFIWTFRASFAHILLLLMFMRFF